MPAAPKVGDALSRIWLIEVFVEPKAEHHAKSDRHIGIAAEIKINLERKGDNTEPCC
ncbi:hypothetical protein D3C73_1589000 [compost metagenome]